MSIIYIHAQQSRIKVWLDGSCIWYMLGQIHFQDAASQITAKLLLSRLEWLTCCGDVELLHILTSERRTGREARAQIYAQVIDSLGCKALNEPPSKYCLVDVAG